MSDQTKSQPEIFYTMARGDIIHYLGPWMVSLVLLSITQRLIPYLEYVFLGLGLFSIFIGASAIRKFDLDVTQSADEYILTPLRLCVYLFCYVALWTLTLIYLRP